MFIQFKKISKTINEQKKQVHNWPILTFGRIRFFLLKPDFQKNTPPHIIYLLGDDMGYGDVSIYNPTGKIHTPHIDQLASQGMRFTDAHSPSSV